MKLIIDFNTLLKYTYLFFIFKLRLYEFDFFCADNIEKLIKTVLSAFMQTDE